jgi:hypothetical protein
MQSVTRVNIEASRRLPTPCFQTWSTGRQGRCYLTCNGGRGTNYHTSPVSHLKVAICYCREQQIKVSSSFPSTLLNHGNTPDLHVYGDCVCFFVNTMCSLLFRTRMTGCKFFGGLPSSGGYLDLLFAAHRMASYLVNRRIFIVRRSHRNEGGVIC